MTKEGYIPRYRFPTIIIKFAVILHIFLPSRTVSVLLFLLFRVNVSYKTVCEWAKKFNSDIKLPAPRYSDGQILICHADEKYVKINGEWNYWWSIKDSLGNLIDCAVTNFRDFASAKELFKKARREIGRDADILVRDGLSAHDKATEFLGRKCKSVVAGINGKPIIFKKKVYFLTDNPIESLNSEIDFCLRRFQNNFETSEFHHLYEWWFRNLSH